MKVKYLWPDYTIVSTEQCSVYPMQLATTKQKAAETILNTHHKCYMYK